MPFISVIPTPGSDIPESSKIFVYGPRFGRSGSPVPWVQQGAASTVNGTVRVHVGVGFLWRVL